MKIGGEFEYIKPQIREDSIYKYFNDKLKCYWYPTAREIIYDLFYYLLNSQKPEYIFLPDYLCNVIYEPIATAKHITGSHCKIIFYQVNDHMEMMACLNKENSIVYIIDYFGKIDNQLIENYLGKSIIVRDITHNIFTDDLRGDYLLASVRKWGFFPGGAFMANVDRTIAFYEEGDITEYQKLYLQQSWLYIMTRREQNRKYLLGNMAKGFDLLNKDSIFSQTVLFETKEKRDLIRDKLKEAEIYLPVHWPCEWTKDISEKLYQKMKAISERILSFVIDHRYGENDMERQANIVNEFM
jgi:hypothetical protein